MFKLAREGVYNNFPSDKCRTLQKVLQVEAERRRSEEKFGRLF